jgi:hypothetical protein
MDLRLTVRGRRLIIEFVSAGGGSRASRISLGCHSRESGNPVATTRPSGIGANRRTSVGAEAEAVSYDPVIPAFAGMTGLLDIQSSQTRSSEQSDKIAQSIIP